MVAISFFEALGLDLFSHAWPDGIVSLVGIFAICCVIGGLVTFILCRTRRSFILKETTDLKIKATNSNRLVNDKNKDVR